MTRKLLKTLLTFSALTIPNLVVAQTTALGFSYAARYDGMRRVTGTIAPKPGSPADLGYLAERMTYDSYGNIVKVEKGELQSWQDESVKPANWSGFTISLRIESTYDSMGRKTMDRTYSMGTDTPIAVAQFSYNAIGLVECTANRMNTAAYKNLPSSACDLGPLGDQGLDRIERIEYDKVGQVTRVIRGSKTDDEQFYASYEYDKNGNKVTVTDASGNTSQMVYDGFDRIIVWNFPSKVYVGQYSKGDVDFCNKAEKDTTIDDYEAYCYDANGNRTQLRRRDGRLITFSYDARDQLVVKKIADGCARSQIGLCPPDDTTRDVYYGYDIRGLQTYARFDSTDGEGISTAYDGFGGITRGTIAMAGQSWSISHQYDADGNQTKLSFPDGKDFNQDYDGLDRLTSISQANGVQVVDITWNSLGKVKKVDKKGAYTDFNYSAAGRLDKQSIVLANSSLFLDFTYNAAGQIIEKKASDSIFSFTNRYTTDRRYSANGQNQYVNAGSNSFTYDSNGNLISDLSTTYLYDGENRLVASSNGATVRYDPLGRIWEIVGPSGTTRFLYDGDQLVAEYDAYGNILRRYVHGTGADDPLLWYEGAELNDRRLLMADHQGSIVAVADASGNSRRVNAYDEYGIPKPDNFGRFQYTGQSYLPELGLYYYKARMYSPTLGRFLQVDPIGYNDQLNLYGYVSDDPVNRTDPTGLYACKGSKGDCRTVAALAKGLEAASQSKKITSDQRALLNEASQALGTEGDGNGVTVKFGDLGTTADNKPVMGEANASTKTFILNTKAIAQAVGSGGWKNAFIAGVRTLGHEIGHVRDGPVAGGDYEGSIRTETRSYGITSSINQAFGLPGLSDRQIQNQAVTSCDHATGQYSSCQDASRRLFPGSYQ